jgi:hypothetical protein
MKKIFLISILFLLSSTSSVFAFTWTPELKEQTGICTTVSLVLQKGGPQNMRSDAQLDAVLWTTILIQSLYPNEKPESKILRSDEADQRAYSYVTGPGTKILKGWGDETQAGLEARGQRIFDEYQKCHRILPNFYKDN